MELPESSGVYLLAHLVTGELYVGSSENIRLRIQQHRDRMNAGSCSNAYLRRLIEEHGPHFSAFVLELTPPEKRCEAEERWIAELKPALNKVRFPSGGSPDTDEVPLNVEVPSDLQRRISIAKAETGKPIKELVREWCENGLQSLAAQMDKPYLRAPKQSK